MTDDRLRAAEVREMNDRVWDMVLHLVTPVCLYVLLQIFIATRLGAHPTFRQLEVWVYAAQFFGAWALLYAVFLKDMGYSSWVGPSLGLLTLGGVIAQFFWFPDPASAQAADVQIFLFLEYGAVALIWPWTYVRWLRLKRAHEAELALGGESRD